MGGSIEIDCRLSCRLDEDEVLENGAFTLLDVRHHVHHKQADHVTAEVVQSWADAVADGTTSGFHGTENGISGNFDSLVLPEATKERLERSVWFTQFFFLLDDKAEALSQDMAHNHLNVHVAAILDDAGVKDPISPMEKVLVPGCRALLAIDHDRGVPVLQAWRDWVLNTDSKVIADFDNFDDYVQFRIINSGMMPYSRFIEYGMELRISPEERESAVKFQQLAVASIALCNDWWSWPKEISAHIAGTSRLINGVYILMKQHNLPAHKARAMLKEWVLESERKLMRMRDVLLSGENVSLDMRKYVQAHMWVVSGHSLWESTCPRYHKYLYFTLSDELITNGCQTVKAGGT
ncbi:hypothetical protein HIM_05827 [Hirsutella minnesotensis 3608]|uniref:Terpene synthase n=1 Tax=Hirsutella minnesotensis 3608 TaxID=1043627 RepID=A0A0F7ZP15_9HYPO|nr:hypothetical protein HIM_05827 [Hirsutella minnesotensis 3608]